MDQAGKGMRGMAMDRKWAVELAEAKREFKEAEAEHADLWESLGRANARIAAARERLCKAQKKLMIEAEKWGAGNA